MNTSAQDCYLKLTFIKNQWHSNRVCRCVPGSVGAQNLPDIVFSSKVDYIRINLEIHSLNYENRNCSIRMQLAAS